MNRVSQAAQSIPGGGMLGKVIFVVLALVALYYLYQYLFSAGDLQGKQVINSIIPANTSTPTIVAAKTLPAFYEGGEYSVNAWIYINDYSLNHGQNKHVLSVGGDNFSTLLVYLGAYKNSLHVRVHTKDNASTVQSGDINQGNTGNYDTLTRDLVESTFKTLQTDESTLYNQSSRPCDIPSVDMQKWVQITITLNNKICDVYIDGKLARSCILKSFFKVDQSNLNFTLLKYNGFGGFVSNVSSYNYSLNPEQVWRMYMAGPGAQYTFMEYISSLFDPKSVNTMTYPKMNINN
jgi:hypothetical protein